MIEKIDKIRDLLIVPSVDEQPKMAINQMKILNLLVELRAEVEQLTIPAVVGKSEQLKAFVDWWHGLSQEELAWYEGRYVEVFLSL